MGGLTHDAGRAAVLSLRLVAIAVFALSLAMIAAGDFWPGWIGSTSPFTLGSVAAIYILAELSLARKGLRALDRVVLSLLFANVFVQSYELIYHFTFPTSLRGLIPPNIDGLEVKHLLASFPMLLPVLLVRGHISMKRTSWLFVALFVAVWGVWMMYGFPQYYLEGRFYPALLQSDDPFTLSLALNYGSKVILAAFFVSLLDPGVASIGGMVGRLRLKDRVS
jgi:hypothetical protein